MPESAWRRMPLTLPTISLALAFSLNPIVRAINMPLMLWNAYPIALRAWRVWRREGRLNVDFLDTLAIAASLMHGSPMAGAIVIWLIKLATNNTIDLKIVLALAIIGLTVTEVGATAATPVWVTLAIFTINHFIEMHPTQHAAPAEATAHHAPVRVVG